MPYTDAIGVWMQLGEMTPGDDWQEYDVNTTPASVFRFRFILNWPDWEQNLGLKSFALLRFGYNSDDFRIDTVGPVVGRLYPKPEDMYWEFPLIEEFRDNPGVVRKLQIKRIKHRRNSGQWGMEVSPLAWRVMCDYLIS